VTLAVNFDFAGEENDPVLVALGTRTQQLLLERHRGIRRSRLTKSLRTALRVEYFADPQGVRNGITAPGHNVDYYEITPTLEYKIWRGLVGRLEYRHDQASRRSFSLTNFSTTPSSRSQDTFSVALSYIFF
jgi:hypothetical protein